MSKMYYKFLRVFEWFRYNFPAGLKNLPLWFKVIWRDRNYDYFYIYKILQHKLKLMEEHIRVRNNHVEAQRDAQQIRVCLDLLNHLIGDDYENTLRYFHTLKWGEFNYKFVPVGDRTGYSKMEVSYTKAKTPEEAAQADKESHEIFTKVEAFKKRCRKLLFKLMANHIEGWWD